MIDGSDREDSGGSRGTLERVHHALYVATREREGREASPTAAIIDSQSAKAAQKGGSTLDPQGFDAAKKVTGRKRHFLVDTLGLLLNVVVHSAAMQDRDGALLVLNRRTRRFFPFIKFIFADAGYQGQKTAAAIAKTGTWKLTILQRNELHRFDACLDQPQSAPRPRLRALRPIRRRVYPSRNDPHHAPTIDQPNSLLLNPNFLDKNHNCNAKRKGVRRFRLTETIFAALDRRLMPTPAVASAFGLRVVRVTTSAKRDTADGTSAKKASSKRF